MKSNQVLAIGFSVLLIVVVATVWWLNRGYGPVSERTYELSKAIYGACLAKSEARLGKIEVLLREEVDVAPNVDDGSISHEAAVPANERKWMQGIIQLAREGHWETAAKKSRRIMLDQVHF